MRKQKPNKTKASKVKDTRKQKERLAVLEYYLFEFRHGVWEQINKLAERLILLEKKKRGKNDQRKIPR